MFYKSSNIYLDSTPYHWMAVYEFVLWLMQFGSFDVANYLAITATTDFVILTVL